MKGMVVMRKFWLSCFALTLLSLSIASFTRVSATDNTEVLEEKKQSLKDLSTKEKSIIIEDLTVDDFKFFLDNQEVTIGQDFDSFVSGLKFKVTPCSTSDDLVRQVIIYDDFSFIVDNSGTKGNLVIKKVSLTSENLWTKRGISIGDSQDDIVANYGKGITGSQGKDSILMYQLEPYALTFVCSDGIVKDIYLSQSLNIGGDAPLAPELQEQMDALSEDEDYIEADEETRLRLMSELEAEFNETKEYLLIENDRYGNQYLGTFALGENYWLEIDKASLFDENTLEYDNSKFVRLGCIDTKLNVQIRKLEDQWGIGYTYFTDDFDKENSAPSEGDGVIELDYFSDELTGYKYRGAYTECLLDDFNSVSTFTLVFQISQTEIIQIDVACSDKKLIESGEIKNAILDSYRK